VIILCLHQSITIYNTVFVILFASRREETGQDGGAEDCIMELSGSGAWGGLLDDSLGKTGESCCI
jgi:hypothetical protein